VATNTLSPFALLGIAWGSLRHLSRTQDPGLEAKGSPTFHEPAGTLSLGQDARSGAGAEQSYSRSGAKSIYQRILFSRNASDALGVWIVGSP